VYLLKENAKPVAVGKKRRKIQLLQLPDGSVHPVPNPPNEGFGMEVDGDPEGDSSAMKWPGKRGQRKPKD
jgi:hypothetical protein